MDKFNDDIRVETALGNLTGWKTVKISSGIDRAVTTFELSMPRRPLRRGMTDKLNTGRTSPLLPGDYVRVFMGATVVVTGRVVTVELERGSDSDSVRIQGASLTKDLVDCSAISETGQWRGVTVDAIAQNLCKPFAITVKTSVDVGLPLPDFQLKQGEKAFAAIERAARLRGLLVRDTPRGELLLSRASTRRSKIDLLHLDGADGGPDPRNNVLAPKGRFSEEKRYSEIIVKGQDRATDMNFGVGVAAVTAKAVDENIKRYRPLILKADARVDVAASQLRADWEITRRMGKSFSYQCKVLGWRQIPGQTSDLWSPDLVTPVRCAVTGTNRDLLITEVSWILSDSDGRVTQMTLEPPEAYAPAPIVADVTGKSTAELMLLDPKSGKYGKLSGPEPVTVDPSGGQL